MQSGSGQTEQKRFIATHKRRPQFWALLGLLFALLLAGSWLVPIFETDARPMTPWRVIEGLAYRSGRAHLAFHSGRIEWLALLIAYAVPYAFALLVALAAIGRLGFRPRGQRLAAWLMLALFLATAAGILPCAFDHYETWLGEVAYSTNHFWSCWILPLAGCVYAVYVMRWRERSALCLSFAGVALCLPRWGYLCSFFVPDLCIGPALGVFISAAATLGLLIVLVIETAAWSRRGVVRTFARLLIARPAEFRYTDGRCSHCGYDLRGYVETRCPECGQEFDPAQVGLTPTVRTAAPDMPPSP